MDRVLTFSEMKTWKDCRQKHQFGYDQRLTSLSEPKYLRRGRVVHKYIDLMYQRVKTGELSIAELEGLIRVEWEQVVLKAFPSLRGDEGKAELSVIVGMVVGYYHAYFVNEAFDGIATEREGVASIDGYPYAFKADAIVKLDGKYWIHEIKTVSAWGDAERRLLNIDEQITHYCALAQLRYGRTFMGAIRTWAKTPGIKQTKSETIDDYCRRVVSDYSERPDFYFGRILVKRTQEQMKAHLVYLTKIREEMTTGNVWKTPTRDCSGCDFFDLCTESDESVRVAIVQSQFRVRQLRHQELSPVLSGPGVQ